MSIKISFQFLMLIFFDGFTVESFGIKFAVPKIEANPNITIKSAPINPIFNQSEGSESDLSIGDISGKIMKEWLNAIIAWNPSLKDIILPLSSYVSGISVASALCGISKSVTKKRVRVAKMKSQKKD